MLRFACHLVPPQSLAQLMFYIYINAVFHINVLVVVDDDDGDVDCVSPHEPYTHTANIK